MSEPFPDRSAFNGAFTRRASDRTPGGVARPATPGRAPGASSAAASETSSARREAEIAAPLDHVPVWPERRQPFGLRWRDIALLATIAILGIAALAGCWPW